ncbi:MAG: hypothetical protein RLO21_13735, partial [Nitratireductor sp.]
MSSRFAMAKDRILGALESVIAELFGANAKPRNRKPSGWNVRNPWRPGSEPRQMYIWLRGARRGAFKDFVSGDKGDAIDLVAFALTGIIHAESRMRAVEWAEDRFGLRNMDKATRAKMAAEAAARRAAIEKADQESRHKARDRVRKFFHACDARILRTPVDAYLAGRGAPLSEVPMLTPALRLRHAAHGRLAAAIRRQKGEMARAEPPVARHHGGHHGRKLRPGAERPA